MKFSFTKKNILIISIILIIIVLSITLPLVLKEKTTSNIISSTTTTSNIISSTPGNWYEIVGTNPPVLYNIKLLQTYTNVQTNPHTILSISTEEATNIKFGGLNWNYDISRPSSYYIITLNDQNYPTIKNLPNIGNNQYKVNEIVYIYPSQTIKAYIYK